MDIHTATEEAYKKGYEAGKRDSQKERPLGLWFDIPSMLGIKGWMFRCSLCGCPQDYRHNYCPNCGAKMDI